ncbi:MAG: exo-beta-N-acetylmuramidase NamZ domain-containing protein [Salinivirgaceae bacterium]
MKKFALVLVVFLLVLAGCKTSETVVLTPEEPKPEVPFLLGLEVLQRDNFSILQGKRVGLVTNPTGVDRQLKSTIDILHESELVNLVSLFGPEHGVRGNFSAGDKVGNQTDAKTGLPVFSLYGKDRKPNAEAMALVDVMVYDIQDIGARSYTYISTMGLVMEAAADFGKEVVVLDRPNPLGGERVEGPLVSEGFYSFVSQFKIPYLYGLTAGELARMLNYEGLLSDGKQCTLQVVPMQAYTRDMTFDETGLQWVPTSPHIPHYESAFYYAVSGIIGEIDPNLIGIGYTLPFQTLATETINADSLADAMNALNLEGVLFRPIYFKPYYQAKKGQELQGVQVHITDFKKARLTQIQFYFLQVAHQLNPSFNIFKDKENRYRMFDLGCGTDTIRKALMEDFNFDRIKPVWERDAEQFKAASEKYYLY